jgi:3-methylcrotonyl-CoA carboxylase alpha subunit
MNAIRLVCGDDRREVDVRETPDGLVVGIDGQAFAPRVSEIGPATFLWRVGDRQETFHCLRDGDTIHLFWRGRAFRLRVETASRRAAARQAALGLEAPMPGRVIAVKAEPGQAVRKGEELLVVESMKMENALRAPHDGTVRSVSARVGDMVSPGAVLVELEPQPA